MGSEKEVSEFHKIVTIFTALAVLLKGNIITEAEFVACLKEEICDNHVTS